MAHLEEKLEHHFLIEARLWRIWKKIWRVLRKIIWKHCKKDVRDRRVRDLVHDGLHRQGHRGRPGHGRGGRRPGGANKEAGELGFESK